MRNERFLQWIGGFAVAGLLVPLLFLLHAWLAGASFGWAESVLWPSSAMLTRHGAAEWRFVHAIPFVYGTALLENIAFYALVGLLIWPLGRLSHKRQEKLHTE